MTTTAGGRGGDHHGYQKSDELEKQKINNWLVKVCNDHKLNVFFFSTNDNLQNLYFKIQNKSRLSEIQNPKYIFLFENGMFFPKHDLPRKLF